MDRHEDPAEDQVKLPDDRVEDLAPDQEDAEDVKAGADGTYEIKKVPGKWKVSE